MPSTSSQPSSWISLVTRDLCSDDAAWQRFQTRIEQGGVSREENPLSHFGVQFVPLNQKTREVFLVHHKKANQWIAAGGHVDLHETPEQTLLREYFEELGEQLDPKTVPSPIFFSILDIDLTRPTCQTHHDLWYAIPSDGSHFQVDPTEFYETRWMSFDEARALVTDQNNLLALERIFLPASRTVH